MRFIEDAVTPENVGVPGAVGEVTSTVKVEVEVVALRADLFPAESYASIVYE